jgi:hypothetical protein
MIYLIVQYEDSHNHFIKDRERIYRIVSEIKYPDLTINNSGVPVPAATAVREEVSGLDLTCHFITPYEIKVEVNKKGYQNPLVFKNQKNIIYTDPEYFTFFQYQWLAGSAAFALTEPFQIILTESRARAYFDQIDLKDIIGQRMLYDDSLDLLVTGIVFWF